MCTDTVRLRLNIVNVEHEQDHESDYDTAVDMSHWSMTETRMTVETAYGLKILLTETSESVTHSYLEPDFDEFEESGEVHYLTHSDESNDSHKTKLTVSVILPVVAPLLSTVLLAERHTRKIDKEAVEMADQYVDQKMAWDFDATPIKFRDEWLQSFFTEFGHVLTGSILVTVPAEFAEEIRRHERRLEEIRAKNRSIKIDNAADFAIFAVLGRHPGIEEICAA